MSMISEQINELETLKFAMENTKCIGAILWKNSYAEVIDNGVKIIDSAIDTIRTLSAKVANENMIRSNQYYNHGWIPTDEMYLPDIPPNSPTAGTFLVTVRIRNESGTFYRIMLDDYGYTDTGARDWQNNPETERQKVIAWMPLPEEYKEVEE